MEKEEKIERNATLKEIGKGWVEPSEEEGNPTEEQIKEIFASKEASEEEKKELVGALKKVEKEIIKPTTGGQPSGKAKKETFQADVKERQGKILEEKAGEKVREGEEMTREER